jgi:hypothetical protein
MLISEVEVQKRRSPRELREFAESVRVAVCADTSEFELGMTKKGLYKEFLDEVLPLSYFAELHYPETYTVQPVLGNQGYDAIVYDDTGVEYDRVEMTKPHDGKYASEDAKLVVKRHFGRMKVGDPADDFDVLLPIVVSTCENKALKDYSDCNLVVIVSPHPPLDGYEDRYEKQLQKKRKRLSKIKFNAKRVFLFIPPNRVEKIAG